MAITIKGRGNELGWVARDCESKVLVAGLERQKSEQSPELVEGEALRWPLRYVSLKRGSG